MTRIDKNGEQTTKKYLTFYSLLIAEDLWHGYYQVLSITILKKFIEPHINYEKMIKNGRHVELNISIATAFLNIMTLNMI